MTVDHVIPVALGGTDEPTNLATACQECNAGKTSSAPEQRTVDAVSTAAAKWSAAMVLAAEEARRSAAGRDPVYEAVVNAWPSYHRHKIPADYTATIDQFLDAGLPAEVVIDMARVAGAKPQIEQRWKYFAGACWNKVRQLQARAAEILDADEPPPVTTDPS